MSTQQDEHTGLQVASTIEIDHLKLGQHFFDWDNEEQARFLLGVRRGYDALGGYGGALQVRYIVDAAEVNGSVSDIRYLVGILHDYFERAE